MGVDTSVPFYNQNKQGKVHSLPKRQAPRTFLTIVSCLSWGNIQTIGLTNFSPHNARILIAGLLMTLLPPLQRDPTTLVTTTTTLVTTIHDSHFKAVAYRTTLRSCVGQQLVLVVVWWLRFPQVAKAGFACDCPFV
eukprot:GHVT01002356.1.p1 GENE.GHVT01002356.1~~GHVT01002356.1.p1  ORF type:complete len:150 (-),score=4.17 GHVT01002356.1:218-625(-)